MPSGRRWAGTSELERWNRWRHNAFFVAPASDIDVDSVGRRSSFGYEKLEMRLPVAQDDDRTMKTPARGPERARWRLDTLERDELRYRKMISFEESTDVPTSAVELAKSVPLTASPIEGGGAAVAAGKNEGNSVMVEGDTSTTAPTGLTDDAEDGQPTAKGGEEKKDEDGMSILKFRKQLEKLNAVTSAAIEELDASSPPPLKQPFEKAVSSLKAADMDPIVELSKRVIKDLQEGFVGLSESVKDFDAEKASSFSQRIIQRMESELAVQRGDGVHQEAKEEENGTATTAKGLAQ